MLDPRPTTPLYTDACTLACGAAYNGRFVYCPWEVWPVTENLHINFKETLAVEVALRYFSNCFINRKVILHCDNSAAVGILNKGTSKNKIVMNSLRRVFWLCTALNCRLYAQYFPGRDNTRADADSRLHEGTKGTLTDIHPVCLQMPFADAPKRNSC